MLNFEFYSPTKFIFGKDAQNAVGKELSQAGYKRVLLHYGQGSAVRSGLIEQVKKSLDQSGIACFELGGVQPNPIDILVYEGVEIARKENIDFILAVGGGSVVDSAKAISVGALYEGDFWDFYAGKTTPMKAIPLGVVLTIPAAGSEGSNSSVITKTDGMLKRGMGAPVLRPTISFMNPELTYTLPAYQTACGVVDMMAHVFERYCSNVTGSDLTDHLCEAVLKTVIKEAPIALREPTNYDARANIMWSGTMAHNDLVGLGREGDWSSHQLEHELSALYGVAHGAGLAVMLPAWMLYQYKHNVPLFAQLAVRVWNCEMDYQHPETTALAGIAAMKQFFHDIGMPTSFEELGAKEEDIPVLVEKCAMNNGDKLGYFYPLDRAVLADVYRLACQ